jgi:hypothetical protein
VDTQRMNKLLQFVVIFRECVLIGAFMKHHIQLFPHSRIQYIVMFHNDVLVKLDKVDHTANVRFVQILYHGDAFVIQI